MLGYVESFIGFCICLVMVPVLLGLVWDCFWKGVSELGILDYVVIPSAFYFEVKPLPVCVLFMTLMAIGLLQGRIAKCFFLIAMLLGWLNFVAIHKFMI